MKLLLDQGLPRSAASLLRDAGVDAVHTGEIGCATAEDATIPERARQEASMITYTDDLAGVQPKQLTGFFEGWPNPPSAHAHLRILSGSSHFVLAIADDGMVIGFVTAISDGVLTAYVPLLEVLPSHRRQGIATQLMLRLLRKLDGLYSINLHCDPDLQPFYESLGMRALGGMAIRNYPFQSGQNAA